jgi:predicted transcriptional regulator
MYDLDGLHINITLVIYDRNVYKCGIAVIECKERLALKLLPLPPRFRVMMEALGRGSCADICLAIMSPSGEWRGFSDVYYVLVTQTRLPWATYSKLMGYLIAKGFVEKTTKTVNNRKAILVRLTDLGKELVKTYVTLQGRKLEDLKPEEVNSAEGRIETK